MKMVLWKHWGQGRCLVKTDFGQRSCSDNFVILFYAKIIGGVVVKRILVLSLGLLLVLQLTAGANVAMANACRCGSFCLCGMCMC